MSKFKLLILLVFTTELLFSQVSYSAIHNKKNILIKIYTSGPDSLKINTENFKLVNYQCFGNLVFLDKKSITNSGDSIMKFSLLPQNLDSVKNTLTLSNCHLRFKLISNVKFKLKKNKKVFIELLINNQLVIIESVYKNIKFCKKIDGAPEFNTDNPVYYIETYSYN
jgi:hypothetical protein